jgi:hypothetical protein
MNFFKDHLNFSNNIWDNAYIQRSLQEAEIYNPEQRRQMRGQRAGSMRLNDLIALERAIDYPQSHGIGPDEVKSFRRVVGDIKKEGPRNPGNLKIRALDADIRKSQARYAKVFGTEFEDEGVSDVADLRKAISFLKTRKHRKAFHGVFPPTSVMPTSTNY